MFLREINYEAIVYASFQLHQFPCTPSANQLARLRRERRAFGCDSRACSAAPSAHLHAFGAPAARRDHVGCAMAPSAPSGTPSGACNAQLLREAPSAPLARLRRDLRKMAPKPLAWRLRRASCARRLRRPLHAYGVPLTRLRRANRIRHLKLRFELSYLTFEIIRI